jgi:L-lactate dehydrogenase (cytochrome)
MLCRILKEIEGSGMEVHMDGGIRSGQDILKAKMLGAHGVHIARPYLFGLGAGGEEGVTRSLDILKKEMDITMALCGERDINNVGKHNLSFVPEHFKAGPVGFEMAKN